jgi:uracil-DNA glycosylase
MRACPPCFPSGGDAPVVERSKESGSLLVGQTPGSTEVATQLPFSGSVGKRRMSWFERAGASQEEVYLSAVSRCFPGKAKGGGDLYPRGP